MLQRSTAAVAASAIAPFATSSGAWAIWPGSTTPSSPSGPTSSGTASATSLARAGFDLVTIAELMGHARLEMVRIYTLPTKADRERALGALLTDR